MALVKFGTGVSGMSGKTAGNVYARNRSGNYARSWRKPVNTPSTYRTAVRGNFGAQAGVWSTLSREVIEAWNALASTATRLNRLGEAYVPTGRQIFLEANLNLAKFGLPQITAAPANLSVPDNTSRPILTVTLSAGVIDSVTVSGVPNTLQAYLKATPPLPAVRSNVANQMRGIGTITGVASPGNVDVTALFTSRFGDNAAVGQQVTLEAQLIDPTNGMVSVPILTRATVT